MEKESTDKSIYQISTQTNTPDKVYDEEINISEALNLMELDRLYKSNLY
jgi:hypothetical protein